MSTRRVRDFAGTWEVTRAITDHLTQTRSHFSGTARFTVPPIGTARFEETGTLTLHGSAPMQANRAYLWEDTDSGIAVFFSDGRLFHHIPDTDGDIAAHWCDPDQYDGHYDFAQWPVWTVTWRVRGPRKDYTSVTTHRRISAD